MDQPPMELPRDLMLARATARDAAYDGVFLTCVRTTGIYCLPSCRAKVPKPANVEHCRTPDEARARGYRACLRCKPDDFYAGRDPIRDALLGALQRVRAAPAEFASVRAFAAAIGTGATKALDLCRTHRHATPADVLLAARVEHARHALAHTKARVLDVALDAGFAGASAFHQQMRMRLGTTPRAFRTLLDGDAFALTLPRALDVAACLRYQTRDADAASERGDERGLRKALVLAARPAVLTIARRGAQLRVQVAMHDGRAPGRAAMLAAHIAVARMLRLDLDPSAAERALAADARLRQHVRAARGLRPWGTATPFECLVWAILGQQVHLGFAQELRAALVQRCGIAIGDLFAHPEPAAVAALDVQDLVALRCSRQKAECLIAAARAIVRGELDLDALALGAADVALATLQRVRGIGPWTAQYVAMRGLLFADCLPAGDSALATAMQRAFELAERPDAAQQRELAAPFAPHRSVLTFQLWRLAATPAVGEDSRARPHDRAAREGFHAAMTLHTSILATPIGDLRLFVDDLQRLVRIDFPGHPRGDIVAVESAPHCAVVQKQLRDYFAGTRTEFALALAPAGTDFQLRAWRALQTIPFGSTASYQQQAVRLGNPRAMRAVGAANGKNPIPIVVPCHRVIGKDGSLTGFGGGLPIKQWLLQHERDVLGKRTRAAAAN